MRGRAGRSPDELAAATAAAQHGVINLTQALACGFTMRGIEWRVGTRRWERVLPRVFRMAGAPRTWYQELMAACLWVCTGAVSHRAAATLWGFDRFSRGPVEVSTTGRVRGPGREILIHRVRRLFPEEIKTIENIPVTSAPRTIIDLCACVEPTSSERILDDSLRRRLTSVEEIWNYLRLEGRRGRQGTRLLRSLLSMRDSRYVPPDSELERRLERLILGSDLPPPTRQFPIFNGDRLVRVFDLCYPEAMLAVEADGYKHHSDRVSWSRDGLKDNEMAALGFQTLRYTQYDLDERPREVIEEIRTVRELRLAR